MFLLRERYLDYFLDYYLIYEEIFNFFLKLFHFEQLHLPPYRH